jgi:hypothetical protein
MCPIKTSGASVIRVRITLAHDFAALQVSACSTIHWSFVDTVSELKVSPVFPSGETSCPASPSLPRIPLASIISARGKFAFCGHPLVRIMLLANEKGNQGELRQKKRVTVGTITRLAL